MILSVISVLIISPWLFVGSKVYRIFTSLEREDLERERNDGNFREEGWGNSGFVGEKESSASTEIDYRERERDDGYIERDEFILIWKIK